MGYAGRRDIDGGTQGQASGHQHGSFGHHAGGALERARGIDATLPGDERIFAARPIDGVAGGGAINREEPVGVASRRFGGAEEYGFGVGLAELDALAATPTAAAFAA